MRIIRRIYNFMKYNKNKRLCIRATILSLYYNIYIKVVPMEKAKKHFGKAGVESDYEDTTENILR